MINIKKTNIINDNLIKPLKRHISKNITFCNFMSKSYSLMNIHNRKEFEKNKDIKILSCNSKYNSIIKESNKNFCSTSINTNTHKKSPTNENICFLKKLNNFRNNGIEYNLFNTDSVFQTIWSNFAYVSYANIDKTFNNNLKNSQIDFTRTDDDSYTIFQDESAFVDYEETNNTSETFEYKTENENSSSLQKFIFSNLDKINNKLNENHNLITRIPQEFNLNINTNRSVKIVNMGDSKLLGDKEIRINFKNFKEGTEGNNVNLEMRRIRSNNIDINAEKGFKVKLTARSYLEGENLFINIPDESVFRVKKIGVANKGKINLVNSEIDIRSVFAPNNNNTDENATESNGTVLNKITNQNHLELACENSNINIGSFQGNNFMNLNNCNLIIDNVDCENFIVNSSNTKSLEIFINSLEKLNENDFFYFKFNEQLSENSQNEENHFESFQFKNSESNKNKKIYINLDNKNDVLIINVNSFLLKLLKNIDKEENELNVDSDLQTKIFSFMHGESNLLSLLLENNINLYDTDQINKNFLQYVRENLNKRSSLLEKLKENSMFTQLKIVDIDIAENIMLINYYFLNVLLKDIKNSYRILFIDSKNKESFEIKDMTAWDITKKRIQNKMSIAHKRVKN